MEDFCALLGLRPAAKYDTTWERIAKAVRDHVPGPRQRETFRQLAQILTGRSEAKRQRKSLWSPLLEKLRQRQA